MRAEDLLIREFDRLSEAPGAAKKLPQFVRNLAVQGRLTNDATVSSAATNACGPFIVPSGWTWARVGDVAKSRLGKMLDKARNRGTRRPYLRNVNVRWFDFDLTDLADMPFEDDELAELALHRGDVLVCEGGEPGRAAVWDERVSGLYFQKAIHRLRFSGDVNPHFFVAALRQAADDGRLAALFTGVTIKHLTGRALGEFAFPLPPLADQCRIVERMNELLAVCNDLEASQRERERRRARVGFNGWSALLGTSKSSANDQVQTGRLSLDVAPEHLQAVRGSIRRLALCGALARPSSIDEPVEEFLRELALSRRVPVSSAPPPVDAHAVPAHWRWVRFGDLIASSEAGWSPKTESFPRTGSHWGVLRVSAVSWDEFRAEENKQLLAGVPPRPAFAVKAGDFLISRANTSELVAKAVVVRQTPTNLMLSDKTVRLTIVPGCSKEYLCLVNNYGGYARAYYAREASGTSASMKNVSRKVIYDLPIPLPPIGEQLRIVERIDGLMMVLNELEAAGRATQAASDQLLDVLLRRSMDSVQTESVPQLA